MFHALLHLEQAVYWTFDWTIGRGWGGGKQARAVVLGIKVVPEEKDFTQVMDGKRSACSGTNIQHLVPPCGSMGLWPYEKLSVFCCRSGLNIDPPSSLLARSSQS